MTTRNVTKLLLPKTVKGSLINPVRNPIRSNYSWLGSRTSAWVECNNEKMVASEMVAIIVAVYFITEYPLILGKILDKNILNAFTTVI